MVILGLGKCPHEIDGAKLADRDEDTRMLSAAQTK